MKKKIEVSVKWIMPDTDRKITSSYTLEVPKGITRSFFAWVAGKRKLPYKLECFMKRLNTIRD